ncbi:MAG: toxin-antitoxin system YwqK family antitoxin [Flavobacteriia bacterium]|jgi:antitoxin component YwqK of YwqJK toxin-antitoxin module
MKWIVFLLIFLTTLLCFGQNVTDSKGKKQGVWSKVYQGSKVYQYKGQFKDDKPIGTFTYYYESSKVKAIIKHSETTVRSEAFYYHENGKLMSYGIFNSQKKDSIWLNFGPSGRLSNSETYKNDQLNGKKTVYFVPEDPNEKAQVISAVFYYTDGKLNGDYTEYFPNGAVMEKGKYELNRKIGIWERYHASGKKMMQERYRNGLRHGWCYAYNEAGTEIGKKFYWEGVAYTGKGLEAKLNELKRKGIDPNQ